MHADGTAFYIIETYLTGAYFLAIDPIQEEEDGDHEGYPGNDGINAPGKSACGCNVKDGPPGEDHCTDPTPAPGERERDRQQDGRDEVHEQPEDGLPEAEVHLEDIQREQAEEQDEKDSPDAWCPVQGFFEGFVHFYLHNYHSTCEEWFQPYEFNNCAAVFEAQLLLDYVGFQFPQRG